MRTRWANAVFVTFPKMPSMLSTSRTISWECPSSSVKSAVCRQDDSTSQSPIAWTAAQVVAVHGGLVSALVADTTATSNDLLAEAVPACKRQKLSGSVLLSHAWGVVDRCNQLHWSGTAIREVSIYGRVGYAAGWIGEPHTIFRRRPTPAISARASLRRSLPMNNSCSGRVATPLRRLPPRHSRPRRSPARRAAAVPTAISTRRASRVSRGPCACRCAEIRWFRWAPLTREW